MRTAAVESLRLAGVHPPKRPTPAQHAAWEDRIQRELERLERLRRWQRVDERGRDRA